MTEEDGFLRRWSRRKTRQQNPAAPVDDIAREAAAVSAVNPPEDAAAETKTVAPEDLPDIDSLDESSDFTVFMGDGVPEELKQMALRRLWRLDPIFNEVDGLVEYGEDFSKISLAAVKSVYQIGKGMVEESEEKLEVAEGEGASEGGGEGEGGVAGEADEIAAFEDLDESRNSTSNETDES